MSKNSLLHSLFDVHAADLHSVFPQTTDTFICPICLRRFSREFIENKTISDDQRLSIGHVWPKYLREKSDRAKSLRVLLCKNCNERAGERGDSQMQIWEQIREGEENGRYFGEQKIEIIINPGDKIQITGRIERKSDNTFSIHGEFDPKRHSFARTNPHHYKRFIGLIDQKSPMNMVIHRYPFLKAELPRVGWVTSAYLFAFYCLGYRYILKKYLDPVRNYIIQSFECEEKDLIPRIEENFSVWIWVNRFFKDPEIGICIPLVSTSRIYLQVNYHRVEIRLPFYPRIEVLQAIISSNTSASFTHLESDQRNDAFIFIPIESKQMNSHDARFDYLLWKPIPGFDDPITQL